MVINNEYTKRRLPNVNKIGIYCITNLVNGKKYIGKTGIIYRNDKRQGIIGGFISRWKHHVKDFNKEMYKNYHIYRSFNKYGINNFEFSIVEIIEPLENKILLTNILNFWERYYINYYDTFNNGYNMTKGGDGFLGLKYSDEHIKKLSDSHKLFYKLHPEKIFKGKRTKPSKVKNRKPVVQLSLDGIFIRKYKHIHQVDDYGFSYKKVSKICNHKYGCNTHKGYIWLFEKEWVELYKDNPDKISELVYNNSNQKQNIEHSIIMKEKYINGFVSPTLGKNQSEETRKKISETRKEKIKNGEIKIISIFSKLFSGKNHPLAIPIVQLTLDGDIVREYDYISQVEDYGFNRYSVGKCIHNKWINKKTKTFNVYKNFIWKVKDDHDR